LPRIFGFGGALIVVAAVVHLLIYVLFGYFDSREGVQAPAEYPLAAAESQRQPPEPRLQTNPRQDLADMRAREDEVLGSYGWVDKNAGRGAHSDRCGDEADPPTRLAVKNGEAAMNVRKKPRSPLRTQSVFVFMISAIFALSAVKQHAQMAAGPATAGYKQEPGIASTALPAPLREIGFDQNIDRRLPLETTFRDEAGATGASRRLLREEAGDSGVRVLRLPDAVHDGDQRLVERARL